MAKKFFQGAVRPGRRGLFTRRAKAAGMGVQAYADKVLARPGKMTTLKREASFAKAARSVAKRRKKQG